MIDALGHIPVTLLVVPDYHRCGRIDQDVQFINAIEQRLARGDEIVLHGYYHSDDQTTPTGPTEWLRRRIYTAREGEFAALATTEAFGRIERGLSLMHGLGWPVHGFVAPAWLLSDGARTALSRLPLAYTTTLREIHALPNWRPYNSPSLVYSVRSPLRRRLSRYWNNTLFARRQACPAPLRMGLHAADAYHPNVVGHWRTLIQQALLERHPMTKYGWLQASVCDAPVPG